MNKKINTQKIAYAALFVAVSPVLNCLSAQTTALSLSLTYIPSIIAGIYMGPFVGFLVGALGDGVGCLLFPHGAWLPLLTLASGLTGVMPWIAKRIFGENLAAMIAAAYLLTLVVCTLGINTTTLWYTFFRSKKTLWVYMGGRIMSQGLVLLLNAALTFVLVPFCDKYLKKLGL